jgi:two-component system, OmpR family, sensor histidine kinase KdpD
MSGGVAQHSADSPKEDSVRARGEHWIFLGYAPGVGKTHAMLETARSRALAGDDVVIGFLQPHARLDMLPDVGALDRVPVKTVTYHGIEFREPDGDAIIARRPQAVVIDELAHANVPGSRCDKRWESVEEILEAGIDVLSTLNVQHVESVHDFVYQVSGVRVTETVPDDVVLAAHVVVVDFDPDQLLGRVKAGLVLPRDEVARGLTHFFRRSTLVALRAQALDMGRRAGASLERSADAGPTGAR